MDDVHRSAAPPAPDTPCLITGVAGFLGSHLAEWLLARGCAVYGTVRPHGRTARVPGNGLSLLPCDVLDQRQVAAAVAAARPSVVFHFAAQSLPLLSWTDPERTLKANVLGTLHLLQAVQSSGLNPTIVLAGSSAEYGLGAAEQIPTAETAPLRPVSPYGISKLAADLLGQTYASVHNLRVLCLRPFLVVGPGKVGDVCSDVARGIVAIEAGQQTALRVGNLDVVRDFLDIRDAVEACWTVAARGEAGQAYNICSGTGRSIREVLDALCSLANKPIEAETDPQRLRPSDEPVVVGDNGRLRRLGWEPRVRFTDSLARILEYWRNER